MAGPTPLATPIAGRTNGNTTYISRQRTVATSSDVWNALRAPSADPGGASTGSRSRRRMRMSPPERVDGGAAVAVTTTPRLGPPRTRTLRMVRPPVAMVVMLEPATGE